jgi:RNA polymerase sigma factor (TIGR02999 family)
VGDDATNVTRLLQEWRAGDDASFDRLVAVVYPELHAMAHRQLRGERAGHTVQTTALVHEAYLRLVDQTRVEWVDRNHFLAVAVRVMRRVLLDYARAHRAAKRGGAYKRVSLDDGLLADADQRADVLIAVDDALTKLAALDERLARVVECRFFAGLTTAETAEVLGVTERTVHRDWAKAKAWLSQALEA